MNQRSYNTVPQNTSIRQMPLAITIYTLALENCFLSRLITFAGDAPEALAYGCRNDTSPVLLFAITQEEYLWIPANATAV